MRRERARLWLSLTVGLAVLAGALPAAAFAGAPWSLKNPVGPQQVLRADLRAVCALDGGTAWVAGAGGAVYFTHDGGATWEEQQTGAPSGAAWKAVRFADMKHGLLLGELGERTLVYGTGDGGATWTPVELPEAADLADVELFGTLHVWAVGEDGAVLRSGDGGATWQQARAGSSDLAAVDFTSASDGVAVGEDGAVLRTADGGATWARAKVPGRADVADLTMRTTSVGWAVGEKGVILRTADGGRSWKRQKTPAGTPDLAAVDFASVKRGWAVTAAGKLLGTTDGGRAWKLERHGMGAVKLRDIDVPTHFADVAAGGGVSGRTGGRTDASTPDPDAAAPDRAFAAGDDGAVGKYAEGLTDSPKNYVYVTPSGTAGATPPASTFSFSLDGYSITDTVSWDGFTTGNDGTSFWCCVQADRAGSSAPAQWFDGVCDSVEMCGANPIGQKPDDMNFAFNGTIGYGPPASGAVGMAFGQGHDGENNWWVGSGQFHYVWDGSQQLHKLASDYFVVDPSGDDGFTFTFD